MSPVPPDLFGDELSAGAKKLVDVVIRLHWHAGQWIWHGKPSASRAISCENKIQSSKSE